MFTISRLDRRLCCRGRSRCPSPCGAAGPRRRSDGRRGRDWRRGCRGLCSRSSQAALRLCHRALVITHTVCRKRRKGQTDAQHKTGAPDRMSKVPITTRFAEEHTTLGNAATEIQKATSLAGGLVAGPPAHRCCVATLLQRRGPPPPAHPRGLRAGRKKVSLCMQAQFGVAARREVFRDARACHAVRMHVSNHVCDVRCRRR